MFDKITLTCVILSLTFAGLSPIACNYDRFFVFFLRVALFFALGTIVAILLHIWGVL